MTDLTPEEFRAACEAAGLEYDFGERPSWVLSWTEDDGAYSWFWYEEDLALPAYVASRLLDRIDAIPRGQQRYGAALVRIVCSDVERRLLATPAQKIRAAMEVLGHD